MAPTQKRTLQDYWKIPFRGFVPGGLNDQKDNPALPKLTEPDDASVMVDAETECVSTNGVVEDSYPTIPVIICDDVSHIVGEVRRYFHTLQVQVGSVETVQLLGVDTARRRAIIKNVGPGSIIIGATESVRGTGYTLAVNTIDPPLEIITTEEVWILQETGQSSNAIVHVFVEFDKQK